ncbi:uncharacterized protein QYS62_003758 [Fusarium acuminatum]|uniref:Uncharacterized protein n=1 Tax=Fusarium acuminatum TaxID=5515 RepID=A0ABZ2WPW3_9HYPO
MASAGTNGFKSPKIPRRPKTPESRQVHFDSQAKPSTSSSAISERITGFTSVNSPSGGFCNNISGGPAPKSAPGTANTAATTAITSAPAPEENADTQPTSFPALGLGPLQWHTSANPTQSLNHQVPASFISPPQQPQIFPLPQFHPTSFVNTGPANNTQSPITYIGIGPQNPTTNHPNIMGDYQNAAPPVQGVHFQPPVPDTTFGPMQHVYVPRFDGGLAGVQVGHPPPAFHYVSPAPFAIPSTPLTTAACTTAIQPVVGTMAPQPNAYGSYVVQQQPYYIQQPAMSQQPVLVAGQQHQQFMPQMQHVAGLPSVGLAGGAAVPGTVPVFAGNVPGGHHVPEVSGMGRTAGEEQLRQIQFAHANKLYEPQEFKPADDDPSRFYYVREVDGNWTQRNRFTIDHMGDSRWYVTDEGWFYAVRLPN